MKVQHCSIRCIIIVRSRAAIGCTSCCSDSEPLLLSTTLDLFDRSSAAPMPSCYRVCCPA